MNEKLNLMQAGLIAKILGEIKDTSEVTRRSEALRRLRIYKDGGKQFLIEQIRREFGEDSLKEMRLAPINLLKKIVNKRSSIYKRPPLRRTKNKSETDQKLMEFYTEKLCLDQVMQKANRYYNLLSNGCVYTKPGQRGLLEATVIPSYLYSIVPNKLNRALIDAYIFSAFVEEGRLFVTDDQIAATGRQGFSREKGFAEKDRSIDSEQKQSEDNRHFIFWSNEHHLTTTADGNLVPMRPAAGEAQYVHELGRMPITNFAKDRDNEPWATQGDDMIDLTIALQLGWTDLLTISKHQGFSVLTIISEEAPKNMVVGINKAVWLKANKDGPTPTMDYKSSGADLSSAREILMELLGLFLSTNEMNPKSIGGVMSAQSMTSGFHALIEMADTLEAREEDKPVMLSTEKDVWECVALWHNKLHEVGEWSESNSEGLDPEAYALGKFSDDFEPEIILSDVKPIESEADRLAAVEKQINMRLMTRKKALKKLYPEMTDEQIDKELSEIDAEAAARAKDMQKSLANASGDGAENKFGSKDSGPNPPLETDEESEEEEEDEESENDKEEKTE